MAEYRFVRTREGITRFAKVTVVSTAAPAWSIAQGEAVREAGDRYGQALQGGLLLAIAEQDRRNGQKFAIVVTGLVEVVADASPDAVECAAAVAAWKSFGQDARAASIRFDDGRWRVAFG